MVIGVGKPCLYNIKVKWEEYQFHVFPGGFIDRGKEGYKKILPGPVIDEVHQTSHDRYKQYSSEAGNEVFILKEWFQVHGGRSFKFILATNVLRYAVFTRLCIVNAQALNS